MKAATLLLTLALPAIPAGAATEYTTDNASPGTPPADWTPSPVEEEIRWHLNRGRFNSPAENLERGSVYPAPALSSGPLAPHYSLTAATRRHSEDLARNNVFQHATVTGSPYYNPATHPKPSLRMMYEGYTGGTSFSENVTAGRDTALAAYLSWWHSAPHRDGMYDPTKREIGIGHHFLAGSRYGHYHTMNLATPGSRHLFTGTVFQDTNGDHVYNSGEGRGGVRVELRIEGNAHSHFDNSTNVGSFAIPIETIPAGSTVEVWLTHTGTRPAGLSIPVNHATLRALALAPGEPWIWGRFSQPAAAVNVGFRNLTVINEAAPFLPLVTISFRNGIVNLTWPSRPGHLYQAQWSDDHLTWQNLSAPLAGTGSPLSAVDIARSTARFYKIAVSRIR